MPEVDCPIPAPPCRTTTARRPLQFGYRANNKTVQVFDYVVAINFNRNIGKPPVTKGRPNEDPRWWDLVSRQWCRCDSGMRLGQRGKHGLDTAMAQAGQATHDRYGPEDDDQGLVHPIAPDGCLPEWRIGAIPRQDEPMANHPRAGTPALHDDLTDISRLITDYYVLHPDVSIPEQQVAFGTSGHRGSAFNKAFNDDHIAATTQAIVEYRTGKGIDGPSSWEWTLTH